MEDIEVLTFTGNKKICVGGDATDQSFVVVRIQCENRWFSGHQVNWKCNADLDTKKQLVVSDYKIKCEESDDAVLTNTCKVEYMLNYYPPPDLSTVIFVAFFFFGALMIRDYYDRGYMA